MTPQEAAKKIIVALDTADDAAIVGHARQLAAHVGMVKIGLEAFVALGPSIIHGVHQEKGSVFLDLKCVDIPATMAGAMRSAARHGVAMMNAYAEAGEDGLRAALKGRDEGWEIRRKAFPDDPKPLLVAVTALTSQRHQDLVKVGSRPKAETPETADAAMLDLVRTRARLAKECGLDGVVCSPKEIALVREACGADFLIVTPGVRPAWAPADDQKRVMTPGEAIKAGSDFLVIGRPILKPPALIGSAQAAVQLIVKELCGE